LRKNVKNYSRYTCPALPRQESGASVRPLAGFAIKNISLTLEANPDSLTAQVEKVQESTANSIDTGRHQKQLSHYRICAKLRFRIFLQNPVAMTTKMVMAPGNIALNEF